MLVVGQHGEVRACGESLARLLGRDVDELAGRPVCALLPGWSPFDATGLECGLRLPALRTRIPVRVACEALHLPGDTLFLLDVRRLSRAAQRCPADAIMVTDHRGEILHVNPVFEAMTGFSRAELAGWTPAILKSGAHDHRAYRELWDTILDGRVYRGVLVNRRKSGELYQEEKVIRPVVDAGGRPILFLCSGRDVAARVCEGEALLEGCTAI